MAFYKNLKDEDIAKSNKSVFAFKEIYDKNTEPTIESITGEFNVGDYVLFLKDNSVWQNTNTGGFVRITELDYGQDLKVIRDAFEEMNAGTDEDNPPYGIPVFYNGKVHLVKNYDNSYFLVLEPIYKTDESGQIEKDSDGKPIIKEYILRHTGINPPTKEEEGSVEIDDKTSFNYTEYTFDKWGHIISYKPIKVSGVLQASNAVLIENTEGQGESLKFINNKPQFDDDSQKAQQSFYVELKDENTGDLWYKDGSQDYKIGIGKVEVIQDASTEVSGKVNTGEQKFAGEKTFTSEITAENGIVVKSSISTDSLTASGAISAKSISATESISSNSVSSKTVEAETNISTAKIDVSPWSIKVDSENALVFSITVNDEAPAPETGEDENE